MTPKQPHRRTVVDRAILAVRRRPIPDGPPADVLSTVLGADCSDDDQVHPITLTKRRVTMKRLATTAAAAAIIAGLLLGLPYLLKDDNGNVAFAEVLEQMQKIKTVKWTKTVKYEVSKKYNPKSSVDLSDSDSTEQFFFKAPGHVRSETSSKSSHGGVEKVSNSITIMDVTAGKYLFLYPDRKEASLKTEKLTGKESHWITGYLTGLKKMITPEAESLGKKTIDGHDVIGFRVRKANYSTDLWVDVKTKNLVLVVMTEVFVIDRVIRKVVSTLSDFEFDRQLDDSLFSLEMPKGYKKSEGWEDILLFEIPENDTPPRPTEKDLIDGLLMWAVGYDGSFPAESMFKIDDALQAKSDDDPENVMLASQRYRAVGRFARYCEDDSWHYAGEGVKLDDKQAAVCWYRPKDSKTYRVIYGDLSVRDVAPDALPRKR